jgi:hypothetical protein
LILTSSSGAQIVFFEVQNIQTWVVIFYFYHAGTDGSPHSNLSDLQKIILGNHEATCITVTSVLEIGRIEKALGIGNVNNFSIIFSNKKICTKPLSL